MLGALEGAGAGGGQGEQGDGGVHGVALGGPERRSRTDGQRAAGPAAGAQRLELDPVLVVADDDAGGGGPVPEALDVGGEAGGAAGGPVRGGGEHRAGGVVQGGPAVDVGGEPGEELGGAVPGERGLRQLALGLEAGGDRAVLVGGDGGGDGLADGEERGAAGHFEERQPCLLGGFHEGGGDVVVVHPDREPHPGDPGPGQPPHVAPHGLGVVGVEIGGGHEEEFTAVHVRDGVGQLAGVGPAHGGAEPVLARPHGELERRVLDERGERGGHGPGTLKVGDEVAAPPCGRPDRRPDR